LYAAFRSKIIPLFITHNLKTINLLLGSGTSDPYSCVWRPKKQISFPSIFWNAKIPFAVYAKLPGASGNRRRMKGLSSVDLVVHARTRTVILTSAASLSDRNELTRFSKWVPSFVCTSSAVTFSPINHTCHSAIMINSPTFQVNIYEVPTLATAVIQNEMQVISHCNSHIFSHNYMQKFTW